MCQRNLHAGDAAGGVFQLLSDQCIVLQGIEDGLDLGVALLDPILDMGLLFGRRNLHHLRMNLRQAAVLGIAVLLQLIDGFGFVGDQCLQPLNDRCGGFDLTIVFA